MLKTALIIGSIFFGIIVTFGIFNRKKESYDKQKVLSFIKENPDKAAITLIKNGKTVANCNSNRLQPLASTVKTIIAIEYAEQAANGTLNPDALVPLSELDMYYVKNTDGGAHPAWLTYAKKDITNNKISIRNIAKGMILFSSNANTEWLQHKLGLDNINKRMVSLGIKEHSKIYYLVSSVFVGKEEFPKLTGKVLQKALKNIPQEAYVSVTETVHEKLLSDPSYKTDYGDLSMPIQKIWSDNLPASTTSEYANLMQKLNSKTYFNTDVQSLLDETMEGMMQSPGNQANLKHAGTKGGSTAFVLTKAFYTTDKKGNTIELALFLNNLTPIEAQDLGAGLNDFLIGILFDDSFLYSVEDTLKSQ